MVAGVFSPSARSFALILFVLAATLFFLSPSVHAMRSTQKVLDMIKDFEGWRNCTYLNPSNLSAIGWGHLIQPDEPQLRMPGSCVTVAEATRLFKSDVAAAETCLLQALELEHMTLYCDEFGALVSWAFNVGCNSVRSSTLLRKINSGTKDADTVRSELLRWTLTSRAPIYGSIGLRRRREKEAELYAKAQPNANC